MRMHLSAWILLLTASVAASPPLLAQSHGHPAPLSSGSGVDGTHRPTFVAATSQIPFELFRGSRLFISGSINQSATPIMLDSGASFTAIDRAFAKKIGLSGGIKTSVRGAGGMTDAEEFRGVTLEVGGLRFENLTVLALDFDPVARAIGRPLPIVLGRDLFNNTVVGLDWEKRQMTLISPDAFVPSKGSTAVKLGTIGPFRSIPVSVAGLDPVEAVLDLGSSSAIILPEDYWGQHNSLSSLRFAETQLGGVGGTHLGRRVSLPTVTLAGATFANVPAALTPRNQGGHVANAANVGIEMLKAFDVTLDLGRSTIHLKPLAQPPVFLRERAGVRTEFAGDRLKVAYVSPDGPAAAAGLKPGDEIVSVDGARVDEKYYERSEWPRGPAGQQVKLERADGSTVIVTLKDYY